MPNLPLDLAGPGLLVGLGAGAGLILVWYVAVFFIEAVILRLFHWASFWRCLLASFLMNLLTTLVGVVFIGAFVLITERWALLLAYFLAWALSVVLEWAVLALMDRRQLRRAFSASLVANTATYVPLICIYAGFGLLAG
ncbi:MAG: hypothetical protein IT317_15340 [Anaerolineales bacterium]|nr:hypothetical protein [Anaerolineales bacterium]